MQKPVVGAPEMSLLMWYGRIRLMKPFPGGIYFTIKDWDTWKKSFEESEQEE
jgi:hypothetical protein